jgi:hypothetical protein
MEHGRLAGSIDFGRRQKGSESGLMTILCQTATAAGHQKNRGCRSTWLRHVGHSSETIMFLCLRLALVFSLFRCVSHSKSFLVGHARCSNVSGVRVLQIALDQFVGPLGGEASTVQKKTPIRLIPVSRQQHPAEEESREQADLLLH